MFENATTLRLRSGKMEIVLYLLRTEIIPIMKKQPGLLHLGLVPSSNRKKVTVISLWTSQEAAGAIEKQCAYLKAVSKLDPYLDEESNPPGAIFNPLTKLSNPVALN